MHQDDATQHLATRRKPARQFGCIGVAGEIANLGDFRFDTYGLALNANLRLAFLQ